MFFFFQAEDGIRDIGVTGVQTCALPISGYPRVTHPSAANPLPEGSFIARLACVRHAASVRPEPGSNSQFKSLILLKFIDWFLTLILFNFQRPFSFAISRRLIHYINFISLCQQLF